MYSPVDGYRCTATAVATASRRQRPQYSMAGPMLFHKVNCWRQVRCGTVATAAGSALIGKVDRWWRQVRCGTVAAAGSMSIRKLNWRLRVRCGTVVAAVEPWTQAFTTYSDVKR